MNAGDAARLDDIHTTAPIRHMQGEAAMSVRELARRLARDPKRVLDDVRVLIQLGLIEKNEDDKIVCPFADIHVDMHWVAAA